MKAIKVMKVMVAEKVIEEKAIRLSQITNS